MYALKSRKNFFESEEGLEIRNKLRQMMIDDTYKTVSSYTPNAEQYPDNLMPFVDKHMNYLYVHPRLDSGIYLNNLRLMTRVR
jgi:hypothetical protein